MLNDQRTMIRMALVLVSVWCLSGCAGLDLDVAKKKEEPKYYRPAKTVASYEEAGRWWGAKHWNQKLTPGAIDDVFVVELISANALDFFWVHSDLKDGFKKGYRLGYQDRTADLVLGPNLTEAAARIGQATASRFVEVINAFEKGWAETLSRAINVFIVLISEGSQADREKFIQKFTAEYAAKYAATRALLAAGGFMTQVSEGGTMLYIDARKTIAVLDIPKPETLKAEIYQQTFRVMGDEWGKRLSHNLIKRDELIDLLRRSRTALMEVDPGLSGNLRAIRNAFVQKESYGTDADNVFRALVKDAGYTETLTPPSAPPAAPSKPAPPTRR
jgi:hypothetical protein